MGCHVWTEMTFEDIYLGDVAEATGTVTVVV